MRVEVQDVHGVWGLYCQLRRLTLGHISLAQVRGARELVLKMGMGEEELVRVMRVMLLAAREINLCDYSLIAFLLHGGVKDGLLSVDEMQARFGAGAAGVIGGLVQTARLYERGASTRSDNFRDLLLSLAQDMRVVLLIICERVYLMRNMAEMPEQGRELIAQEAAYLYAPLAHKLGLYRLKSELEDLSLKQLNGEMYDFIKRELSETKASRDQYIEAFIRPIREKVAATGVNFSIKGRTKSIHSIYSKMRKQKCDFHAIYDLFAIRVIIDAPKEREKGDCWQVYSLITDMYQPNPKRLRDWLSIPKSNGYESLHITVMGTGGKWVEVQIRTRRMDEIAERGVAAHWRYKGQGESGMDAWLASVREALENSGEDDDRCVMDRFKMDLYEDEVFVFTPKGDLFKLPKGSSVLDFAFHIHSRVGCTCIGAKVNGRNVRIGTTLKSGDQVEILTSSTQTPKQDWLHLVSTSKARNKIRQVLKENTTRQAEFAKEDLMRKFRNRKIELSESFLMRFVVKQGYKSITEFYQAIAEGVLDAGRVVDMYVEARRREQEKEEYIPYRSAEQFTAPQNEAPATDGKGKQDVLLISDDLNSIDFSLARCCNPIYGDEVFGFVLAAGGVKVHRNDCPNAAQMRERFGYRVIPARWAGHGTSGSYHATLNVVGTDDIGIVTNLSSLINKEPDCSLRSLRVDSHDGLFTGQLTLSIRDTGKLNALIRKLLNVKGVKQVHRT